MLIPTCPSRDIPGQEKVPTLCQAYELGFILVFRGGRLCHTLGLHVLDVSQGRSFPAERKELCPRGLPHLLWGAAPDAPWPPPEASAAESSSPPWPAAPCSGTKARPSPWVLGKPLLCRHEVAGASAGREGDDGLEPQGRPVTPLSPAAAAPSNLVCAGVQPLLSHLHFQEQQRL